MEFFAFPHSCMKMFLDSAVAQIEPCKELVFAFLFSLLSLRLFLSNKVYLRIANVFCGIISAI